MGDEGRISFRSGMRHTVPHTAETRPVRMTFTNDIDGAHHMDDGLTPRTRRVGKLSQRGGEGAPVAVMPVSLRRK